MVRVLAVSDVVDEVLCADVTGVRDAELILACGDLPFEYLGGLMNRLDVPLVFVPGNHDPDVSGYRVSRAGLTLRAGLPARPPWPDGAINADGQVVDVLGLRIAGLGGCPRYSAGPNQYTDRQQARRGPPAGRPGLAAPPARRDPHRGHPAHARTAARRRRRTRPTPPGLSYLNALTRWLRPALLLHGTWIPSPVGDGTVAGRHRRAQRDRLAAHAHRAGHRPGGRQVDDHAR